MTKVNHSSPATRPWQKIGKSRKWKNWDNLMTIFQKIRKLWEEALGNDDGYSELEGE